VPIAVSGSIATDHLMSFAGRFVDQLLPDQLAHLSVSFLVDDLEIRRGGVAGNICFGLCQLGLNPLIVGAVGDDFAEYRAWLDGHGADTSAIRVCHGLHTARFVCTTDSQQNQIASFYPGAMSEAREIDLTTLGDLELVLIGANDPAAMAQHTEQCRKADIPFAADPSQQLAFLDGEAIRDLLDGASLLFGNAYEAALFENKTGWSTEEVLSHVGVRVTTHGAEGIVVEQRGEPTLRVGVVPARAIAEPTGVGDAFRAGFLAARSWGLSLERSAQLGALLATLCVESIGPQEYRLDGAGAQARLTDAYGEAAAEEIAHHLS
jgi:adenosine kinase